jgi:N-acetyl-anhydromuramyl-L-alanine amidase AmpD
MAFKLTWLADVLRAAGCTVEEVDGWRERGRSEMGTVKGVLLHHTAGAASGNAPSLNLIVKGRPDLPGPLSQLVLGRDGTWYVVAAGRCNHAGAGAWQGVTAGNSELIGVEAENMGTGHDPWPVEQMMSYAHGVAAILQHIGAHPVMAGGHKEYALPKGRKIDPAFDMVEFREEVEAIMAGGSASVLTPTPTDPKRSMLRLGDQGTSVRALQGALLMLNPDGAFGPKTQAAVIAFQKAHGLKPDGLVGPATWEALL